MSGDGTVTRSRFYEAYRWQTNKFGQELKQHNREFNLTLLIVRLVTRCTSNEGYSIDKFLTEIEISPPRSSWLLRPSGF